MTTPRGQLRAAQAMVDVLRNFMDESRLSMGGGTVLQWDWKHRRSTDVDMFYPPDLFAEACRLHGDAIERALVKGVGSPPKSTWMEPTSLYAEVDGVETTVLPGVALTGAPMQSRCIPDTRAPLQTPAEILAKKLFHRLYEAETVEVRDLYDIAAAWHCDAQALQAAMGVLPQRALASVSAMVQCLPVGWGRVSAKPLIDPRFDWSEDDLREQVVRVLEAGLSADADAGVRLGA